MAQCDEVHVVFVLDRDILDALPRSDRRVEFILAALREVDAHLHTLCSRGRGGLIVRHGWPTDEVPQLARNLHIESVFAANDYEPAALQRDAKVRAQLARDGIHWTGVKDHVLFESREIVTQAGQPYTVFTPYARNWRARLLATPPTPAAALQPTRVLAPIPDGTCKAVPTLEDIGFVSSNLARLALPTGMSGGARLLADFLERIDRYDATRNYPAIKGPSYLSPHLRFGTVSVRHLAALAFERSVAGSSGATTWLNELGWRDFYFQILSNFPHVATGAFREEYDRIVWESGAQAELLFEAWCAGRTGYPLVDAAMLQLNETGYMHNRLRMVAGSFLVKSLGIHWQRGEAYFAQHLNDFDFSANNGGWQWVASSGCDAQPYFRIFNPVRQSETFDAEGKFIVKYLPQLAGLAYKYRHAPWLAPEAVLSAAGVRLGDNYPRPVVDHAMARARTLARYAVVKSNQETSGAVQ